MTSDLFDRKGDNDLESSTQVRRSGNVYDKGDVPDEKRVYKNTDQGSKGSPNKFTAENNSRTDRDDKF